MRFGRKDHAIDLPETIMPNKETIAAMRAARDRKLVTVGNIDRLLDSLKQKD